MTDDDSSDGRYVDRLVDRERLESYLETHFGPAETFEIEHLGAGHSNETLHLRWGQRDLALRRPPPGATAETAHDVRREYRIIDALQDELPVPTTHLSCEDESVIGSDFYVTEYVEGDVIRDTEPERFATPEHRATICEQMMDLLADIHTLDYEAAGLADLGTGDGYLARQVGRMTTQIEWATERTNEQRAIPELAEIGQWLDANVPESPTYTLVHGDYKLDNLMFGPATPPEPVAIFDWELSTIGDPLADIGWLLFFWNDADGGDPIVPEVIPTFTDREGYYSVGQLVERYESRSGIEFQNAQFYRTLALYKAAAVSEMFFARYLEGSSNDPLYAVMEKRVPELAETTLEAIEENRWG